MRILVAGDSYMGADYFRRGLEPLERQHEIVFIEIGEGKSFVPVTASELALRETIGAPGDLLRYMDGVDVLVVHGAPVTEEVLRASESLQLVCCARGGPVNIDVDAASSRGIPVVTTPGKNAEAVADQTIAFMVMLARGFGRAQRFLLDGGTVGGSAFEGRDFMGDELGGQGLGLVGYGHVGRRVAARADAFGMETVVYDPFVDGGNGVVQVTALEELLVRSRFVSLHTRATPQNVDFFGTREFATMQRGAFFINTARETLVDEQALDRALDSGQLGGAALDVLRPHSGNGPHPILRHRNIVVTPHIGGATEQTLQRGAAMISREIQRFTQREQLTNVANGEAVDI
jgi:D-3-phosphoglycerate dehydrogenase